MRSADGSFGRPGMVTISARARHAPAGLGVRRRDAEAHSTSLDFD